MPIQEEIVFRDVLEAEGFWGAKGSEGIASEYW